MTKPIPRNNLRSLLSVCGRSRKPSGRACSGKCRGLRDAAALQADIAVLDEIDSGLDIDALRDVADAVNSLKRPNSATLMVTHYKVPLPSVLLTHLITDGIFCALSQRHCTIGGHSRLGLQGSEAYRCCIIWLLETRVQDLKRWM